MNVAIRKHIRQATYADIPQLIELSDPIFTADGMLRDPSDIAAHFASHIGRAGCVVLVSDSSFAIGIHTHAVAGDENTMAAFTTAWADEETWPDLVWAAEAWAEGMGASELRFGLLANQIPAKTKLSEMDFDLHSVFMARPVISGAATQKDIEQ